MIRKISCILLILILFVSVCFADVVIKVRAVNPLDENTIANIKYPLADEINPGHIFGHKIIYGVNKQEKREGTSDFEIKLDENKGTYYISQDIELMPKEVVTLEVTVKDVWAINEANITGLKDQVKEVFNTAKNSGKPLSDTIILLNHEILNTADGIIQKQNKNSVNKVGVDKHIQAYRKNLETLQQLFSDISMLRTLIAQNDAVEETLTQIPEGQQKQEP